MEGCCGAAGLALPAHPLAGQRAKCLPVAGQQAGDSVLGICAKEFLAAENCFCGSLDVEAAACTRPDGAVVYWTSARIIINVRGSCALIGELGRYPKNKNHKHEKHTSTSTGLRQPRTQHDGGHGNMAHAHVARILGITTGRGRHAVLRKLGKALRAVAHSGRAHRRRWHGAQRHRFQPRIKSRRCCASAARFKPIFKQTAACQDAERFLS